MIKKYNKKYYKRKYFTEDDVLKESITCKTRTEFMNKFPGARAAAIRMGILEKACEHMLIKSYSMPQLIIRQIMEGLFDVRCKYNDRKLITPYEIDILFEQYNLAIEYNGERWHRNDEVNKFELCKEKNVFLITIKENNRKYEEDVKNQLINNLDVINKMSYKNITKDMILNFKVDYIKIVPNLEDIRNICLKYDDYKEFREKEPSIVTLLRSNKIIYELTSHMKRKYRVYVYDENFINNIKEIIKNFKGNISKFSKEQATIYGYINSHNLSHLLEHLREQKEEWNLETIIAEIKKYEFYTDFHKNSDSCYSAVMRMGLDYLLNDLKRKRKAGYTIIREGDYTIESCMNCISKYSTLTEFIKDEKCGVYNYCYKHDLKHLYAHLEQREKWTEEKLIQCISECKTIKELSTKYPKAYETARQTEKYKHLLNGLKRCRDYNIS